MQAENGKSFVRWLKRVKLYHVLHNDSMLETIKIRLAKLWNRSGFYVKCRLFKRRAHLCRWCESQGFIRLSKRKGLKRKPPVALAKTPDLVITGWFPITPCSVPSCQIALFLLYFDLFALKSSSGSWSASTGISKKKMWGRVGGRESFHSSQFTCSLPGQWPESKRRFPEKEPSPVL